MATIFPLFEARWMPHLDFGSEEGGSTTPTPQPAISITLKIPILPGNKIIVPGTEPSSALTSKTLEIELTKIGRQSPGLVNVKDVLRLIPGSYIDGFINSGISSRFLVLPSSTINCPCMTFNDWYAILFELATPATDEDLEEIGKYNCDVLDNNYNHLCGS